MISFRTLIPRFLQRRAEKRRSHISEADIKKAVDTLYSSAGGVTKEDLDRAMRYFAAALEKRLEPLEKAIGESGGKLPSLQSIINSIMPELNSVLQKVAIGQFQDQLPALEKTIKQLVNEHIKKYEQTTEVGKLVSKISKYRTIITIGGAAMGVIGLATAAIAAYVTYQTKTVDLIVVSTQLKKANSTISSLESKNSKLEETIRTLITRDEFNGEKEKLATKAALEEEKGKRLPKTEFDTYKQGQDSRLSKAESTGDDNARRLKTVEDWKTDYLTNVYGKFVKYVNTQLEGDKEKNIEGLVKKVAGLQEGLPQKADKESIEAYGKKLEEVGANIAALKHLVDIYEKANAQVLKDLDKEKGDKSKVKQELDALQQKYADLMQNYQKLLPRPEQPKPETPKPN